MTENSVILSGGLSWKLCVLLLAFLNLSDFGKGQEEDDLNLYICMDTGNYTANSTYSANLKAALSALSLNMTEYGFYNASAGQGGADRAHAVALCRPDISLKECRECVENAATELLHKCPNQKQAIRWYEYCTLHYSNLPINGNQANSIDGRGLINTANVRNPVQFRQDRSALVDVLRELASNGSSLLKVGAGSRNTIESETLNALLQCIPTLSPQECSDCLLRASQDFPRASEGARQLRSSCIIRYELYPFYNETRLRELHVRIVLPPQTPIPPPGKKREKRGDKTAKLVIIVLVSIAVCLLILAACAIFFLRRRRTKKQLPEIPEPTEDISTAESLQYDFHKISAATNDFAEANKLGQGGFGAVYRGKLLNGQQIAVKRLARESGQGGEEFKNEVLLLARLQHRNLVRLLGFSVEGKEKLLIYEYVPNGSLDQLIFDPTRGSELDWERRYKIIGGIARGLVYLHEDSRLRIVHRDLKASNILLNREMNPKIADFGMARLFGPNETKGDTHTVAGTYGYMPPEYAIYGRFSVKSDVFSFGVIVLEIISGQKNINGHGEKLEDLLSFAWKNWRQGSAENVIDPVLRAGRGSVHDMLRCIHIGLLCVQEDASDRPTMTSIVLMLSSSTVTLPVPSQPAFYMSNRLGSSLSVTQENGSTEYLDFSKESKIKANMSEGSPQDRMSGTAELLCPR